MEIEYENFQNEKAYNIKSIKIAKTIRIQKSMIIGISYNERLNLVISWSNEGVISINNDYSFNFLNIISLGNPNLLIKEILVAKYDLLIIYSYNFIKKANKIMCYTLNGIQVASNEISNEIVECFTDEKLIIIYANGNIFSHDYYNFYDLYKASFSDYIQNYEDSNVSSIKIKYCFYLESLKSLLIIHNNYEISCQRLPNDFFGN